MPRPITRRCCDCNAVLKNRGKRTKRCWKCWASIKTQNARGRTTGNCIKCGEKLSLKRNVTGCCASCLEHKRGFKRPHGKAAWNKGQTIFTSEEHRVEHRNKLRRLLRTALSADKKIADRIRTLIRISLKHRGIRKNSKTAVLLGCSPIEFCEYLQSKFTVGMSWANYGNGLGKWNVDHIRPLCTFDLTDPAQQLLAFHFSNCRPLWAIENFSRPRSMRAFDKHLRVAA